MTEEVAPDRRRRSRPIEDESASREFVMGPDGLMEVEIDEISNSALEALPPPPPSRPASIGPGGLPPDRLDLIVDARIDRTIDRTLDEEDDGTDEPVDSGYDVVVVDEGETGEFEAPAEEDDEDEDEAAAAEAAEAAAAEAAAEAAAAAAAAEAAAAAAAAEAAAAAAAAAEAAAAEAAAAAAAEAAAAEAAAAAAEAEAAEVDPEETGEAPVLSEADIETGEAPIPDDDDDDDADPSAITGEPETTGRAHAPAFPDVIGSPRGTEEGQQRVTYVAQPTEGPLALLVLDDVERAWRYESRLHRFGYRTRVRKGFSESLHAIREEEPVVIFVEAWEALEGVTFLQVAGGYLRDLTRRCVAVHYDQGEEGLRELLEGLGVLTFVRGGITQDAIKEALALLRLPDESLDQIPALPPMSHGERRPPLVPGETIAGRFIVEGLLGRGATASVYRVRDLLLNVGCALKLLDPESQVAHAAERFRREAGVTRALAHPSIVRTWEYGLHEGVPYYTMEVLAGETIEDIVADVRSGKPLPMARRLELLSQILSALAAVHAQQVLHRDLKPENIVVVHEGKSVKLLDFGMACFEGERVLVSVEGTLVGSPAYAAPELLVGEAPPSRASDLYAVGVIAYELVTGRRPVEATDILELLIAVPKAKILPPRRHAPDLPPEVEGWIMGLLARDPARRPTPPSRIARDIAVLAAQLAAPSRTTSPRGATPSRLRARPARKKKKPESE